jgi:lambda family phage minor tail protein L
MSIREDIQKLEPGILVELFEVYVGVDVFRFHSGLNQIGGDVVFDGNTYIRFPIDADGFEWKGSGTLARPKLRVANVTGLVGALVRENNDLVGCKVVRRRTFAKYLDAVNFPGGVNPTADPSASLPDEVYFIDRKSAENSVVVEFELAAAMDVHGVRLPRRQVIQNVCTWRYRSAECGYAGGAVADINDQATTSLAADQCGKRLASCKLRFGDYAELPFGGFPAAGLIR